MTSKYEALKRYFTTKSRQAFEVRQPEGSETLEIFYHSVPCGTVFVLNGARIGVRSEHINLKRRNEFGRNVMLTIDINKAKEIIDTYIRLPSSLQIINFAISVQPPSTPSGNSPIRNLVGLVQSAAREERRTAFEPIDDWYDGLSKASIVSRLLYGLKEGEKDKYAPAFERYIEAAGYEEYAGEGWAVAHDKIDNVYHVTNYGSKDAAKLTVLPNIFMDKISVLRVCQENEYTVHGGWKTASKFLDIYYLIGKDLHDPRKQG